MSKAKRHIAKMAVAAIAAVLAHGVRAASFETIDDERALSLGGASGGDERRLVDNGDGTFDIVHIFTNTASAGTFAIPSLTAIDFSSFRSLVAGGGGAGGSDCGGGGGAGGLLTNAIEFASGASYSIYVGAGAATTAYNGPRGGNGSATAVTNAATGAEIALAFGGGGGGTYSTSSGTAGLEGGSGGGGTRGGAGGAATQPSATWPGLGNAGGNGAGSNVGGGGGGATGAGGVATTGGIGGAGGAGFESDISGETAVYACGGGGRGDASSGVSGDGDADDGYGDGGTGARRGQDGKPATGNGGGGGGTSSYRYGGGGGSGVAIVRYTVISRDAGLSFTGPGEYVALGDGTGVLVLTNASSNTSIVLDKTVYADILLVGGGGAGASPYSAALTAGGAGGGGAGGMLEAGHVLLKPGVYTLSLGAGGAAPASVTAATNGADGNPTTLSLGGTTLYTAPGGGGGGITGAGRPGGSGGGAGKKSASGGAGIDGLGCAGGSNAGHNGAGAGGGGAGGAGGDTEGANKGGAGGAGKASFLSGRMYAYGGGGGARTGTGGEGAPDGSGHGAMTVSGVVTEPTPGVLGGGGGGGRAYASGTSAGCGASGGDGVFEIRISFVMPEKPEETYSATYDGSEHVFYSSGYVTILDADGNEVDSISAVEAGTHVFTVAPKDGYVWADDATGESVSCTVTILPAQLVVTSLELVGWQLGMQPATPVLASTPAVKSGDVTYLYSSSSSGPWSETPPETAGTWYVTAQFAETDYYTQPEGTIPVSEFRVWERDASAPVVEGLGYYSTLTVTGYDGETLENFPMLVRVSEDSPLGFSYEHARSDGSDLRFVDENGDLLPCQVDEWHEGGESLVWVRVPEYKNGAKLTMCWGTVAGAAAPAVDASAVWDGYCGVWHMNEEISAAGASSAESADSTANANHAYPHQGSSGQSDLSQMVSTEGAIGRARVNGTVAGLVGGNRLWTKDNVDNGSVFTFTGWYKFDSGNGNTRLVSSKTANNVANGWGVETVSGKPNLLRFRTSGSALTGSSTAGVSIAPADLLSGWVHLGFVVSNTTITVYANGEQCSGTPLTASAAVASAATRLAFGGDMSSNEYTLCGQYDELRVILGVRSADWIKAEYLQSVQTGAEYEFSPKMTVPDSVFENFWRENPSIESSSWAEGAAAPAMSAGVPAYGQPYWVFYSTDGSTEITNAMPSAAGVYTWNGYVDGREAVEGDFGWAGLEYSGGAVSINTQSPYTGLSGSAGSTTLSGRVLLANNDDCGDFAVTDQDYNLTNSSESATWWEHSGETDAKYLFNGCVSHVLKHNSGIDELCGADTIWRLENVLVGTPYINRRASFASTKNYLPAPETSGERADSSNMALLNSTDSAIYSPCYTNGMGTVYFDLVNLNAGATAGSRAVCVEVCKAAADGSGGTSIPTDANVAGAGEDGEEADPFANAVWEKVSLLPFETDGEGGLVALEATEDFSPEIADGGSDTRFCRVAARIDCYEPCRFRIRRTGTLETEDEYEPEYVLVDNIVVSYPPMRADLAPRGKYDESLSSKITLGQEAAWDVPFPAAGEESVHASADVSYSVNPAVADADPATFVKGAVMHYRWRYLDQAAGDWKTVGLDHTASYLSSQSLDMPAAPARDVEFYFETFIDAPFYEYHDYTGLGIGMDGKYTENVSNVVNRASGLIYPSGGTDWFVRLREGRSDYERMILKVCEYDSEGELSVTNSVDMELVKSGVWRGFYKTPAAISRGILFRIEPVNLQERGIVEWSENSNVWTASEDIEQLPLTKGTIEEKGASSDAWTACPCDAETGYLLFQIDETTKALVVVRADYQDFNSWSDANKSGLFVGSSVENDEYKSGVSPRATETKETFDEWADMPASDSHWQESFDTDLQLQYEPYEAFTNATADTINGWQAGPGMFVYGKYRDERSGLALQMEGCGKGFVQYVNSSVSPRGIGTVSFNARLAQSIDFTDFSYYDCGDKFSLSNYTVAAYGAFDQNQCKDFSGNASLSLVANYVPDVGCYEFRVEQAQCDGTKSYGLNRQGTMLSLYRWRYDEDGNLDCSRLGAITNSVSGTRFNMPLSGQADKNLWPMYLSVSNESGVVCLSAGVLRNANGVNLVSSEYAGYNGDYSVIVYRDSSDDRLESGTYGCLAANSPGRLNTICKFANPVPYKTEYTRNNHFDGYSTQSITFSTNGVESARSAIAGKGWRVTPGRMESYSTGSVAWGLKAKVPVQTIAIRATDAGTTTGWTTLTNVTFSSFGSSAKSSFNIYKTEDCSVRIEAGGNSRSRRTDVVIDDIEVTQWRGVDWEEVNSLTNCVPNWTSLSDYRAHTNVVFTSGWITNKTVLLSARRTTPGTPCSIRSPLYDGSYGRGVGLGMFSFSYENAQTNVNLVLQIATNVTYDVVGMIDNLDTAVWQDVTNFNFATCTQAECKSGTRNCYLGMHGVKGVMRILMDTNVVASVASETDPARFGDIYIKDVTCRDEPVLDDTAWWGWNLRTLGADDAGADSENRMYLADMTQSGVTGMSLALNNSVTADVDTTGDRMYVYHLPFVQTPLFSSDIVGEINFKARRYDTSLSQPALVSLYGSKTGEENGAWAHLADVVVTNDLYETYTFKTDQGVGAYRAFRLAVIGVPDCEETKMPSSSLPVVDPEGKTVYGYSTPVRVLIDEVFVSERLDARVGFKNVGVFRNKAADLALNNDKFVPGVPGEDWQPLCNEAWGVQCEVEAKQLGDEVDFDRTPLVKLYWFEGSNPWGFSNWKDEKKTSSAWLSRASDTNLVYRSSYLTSQDAIVPPSTAPGTVVQYGLEVVWYRKGSDTPLTNTLESVDWERPEWYNPVDLNKDQAAFSAYNILDTVAPHWAWINEINVFGKYDSNFANTDADYQYVEIAVPAEADITGWHVDLLEPRPGEETILTNRLGTFGTSTLEATKTGNKNQASNMVFRVLANSLSGSGGRLSRDDGELDAVWDVDYVTSFFNKDGEILATSPVGFRLVRASGIVEHEVTALGQDWWGRETGVISDSTQTKLDYLNDATVSGANFIFPGQDDQGEGFSMSVLSSNGSSTNHWSAAAKCTPGRINEGQEIDPDHPTPNGTSVIIYANLNDSPGHIYQTAGDAVNTNGNLVLFVTKGSDRGTNIVYTVDNWYELGSVTAGGVPVEFVQTATSPKTYTVNVGKGAQKNMTVLATAKVQDSVLEAGVEDRYREAVMDWLCGHKDAYGNDWADPDATEVKLADFVPLYRTEAARQLTLTEMYWFDMDPTVGDLALVAGMSAAPQPRIIEDYYGSSAVTNVRMGVYMLVTNRTEDATSPYYGSRWTPYVLRGIEPGSSSWDYDPRGSWGWTGVTFKVTGLLANGLTSESNGNNWIPLRWFVFQPDSFDQTTFTSQIEVTDPFGTDTPGYSAGWYDWVREHGSCPVFFSWSVDGKFLQIGVENLKKENYYETD